MNKSGNAMNSPSEPWSWECSIVSGGLKRFVAEKIAQARAARPPGMERSPQFDSLLAAAEKGDWPILRDILAKWHVAAMKWENYFGCVQSCETIIALELEGAFEQFAGGVEEYAVGFGRDVMAALPPGSVLFCSHGARGIITVLCESHVNAEPCFTLSQEAMADKDSLDYWRGIYGDRIYVPTDEDGANCYNEYREDARRRLKENKLLPGESVTEEEVEGKVQFGNWISTMAINGLVTKLMFDKNPDREFYVEQGFPIEWMQPHLSPHGLIMRINRQPLAELSDEIVQRDRNYWTRYLQPMLGDWLNYDTSVAEIAAFVEKVHVNHDLCGFKGDLRFIQNERSQRLFSRLRPSIGGLYLWRATISKNAAEKERMLKEADFAFRQSFALCPRSPEAVFRYAGLLLGEKRFDDAILIMETAKSLDPENAQFPGLLEQLKRMKGKAQGS
jgi:hypothetical protein